MAICSDEGSTPSTSTMTVLSEPYKVSPVRIYTGFGVFVFEFPLYNLK